MVGQRLRAALIGTGRIGQEHLACLQRLPDAELVGVCDREGVLAEMTAERYGVPQWFQDHRMMLAEARPDIVHITTPVRSHVALAVDALDAGCHVFVEKPVTASYEDFLILKERALQRGRHLMEDHNFLYNRPIRHILELINSRSFGPVVHLDIFYSAAIVSPGSPFIDPDMPHESVTLRGGAIADFLPHLSYLTHALVGRHVSVRTLWRSRSGVMDDDFRALIEAERGTASLTFTAHSQPEASLVRVYGGNMQAETNLSESRLTVQRIRDVHPGLLSFCNGIQDAWDITHAACEGVWWRLAGRPVANHGMWELIGRVYKALRSGSAPPVTLEQIDATSRLFHDLTDEKYRV